MNRVLGQNDHCRGQRKHLLDDRIGSNDRNEGQDVIKDCCRSLAVAHRHGHVAIRRGYEVVGDREVQYRVGIGAGEAGDLGLVQHHRVDSCRRCEVDTLDRQISTRILLNRRNEARDPYLTCAGARLQLGDSGIELLKFGKHKVDEVGGDQISGPDVGECA